MTRAHRLEGLEPDNLLAFLALLGLLRALETARPDWRPRAWWNTQLNPLRPVLTLSVEADAGAVAEAAAEGVAHLAAAHRFDRADLRYQVSEFAAARAAADPELVDALMSDAAVREEGTLWPTPLCFLFGQGHQHFLDRLAGVPQGRLPGALAKAKRPPELNSPVYIADALFATWRRDDPADGLRWDPAEDRRYALRSENPSGDPNGMEHGANRLAAIGLAALGGAAVAWRGEARFLNRMTNFAGPGRAVELRWPVWSASATLAGVRALLAHRDLWTDDPASALNPLGVAQVYRAARISVGKFFNVTLGRRV
jgi:hypothetical protein